MKYEITNRNCVARFFYKGSHSHPVRRTVLIISQTKDVIVGYELREGNKVRTASIAPVKSYSRKKIARGSNLRLDNPIRKLRPNKTTLVRKPLIDVIKSGF